MRRRLLVLVLVGTAGCALFRSPEPAAPPPTADALLAEADAESSAGRVATAAALYERIARENQGQPAAARALLGLAALRLDPRSPIRDRRAGQTVLARVASEYPKTPWGREARAWRMLMREADRCEEEAARLGADADRLRQTLETLKDSDLELEQHP
ncbi:MAG TPA: hypothetical protein VMS22_21235 [Candidatus Eisenbacteria bacterium]|nr:hypothetical protein [Candidatus Eisenbacteria bacterium]